MTNLIKKILLISVFISLVACGSNIPDINAFKKGEVVAWTVLGDDKHTPSTEQNCEKVFGTKNGLILVHQIDGNNQITTLLWGGSTEQSKKDANPMRIDPISGLKGSSKIESSSLVNDKLTQIVTRSDGAKQKIIFSQNKKDKNQLRNDGWEYVEATDSQINHYNTLKRIGALKPEDLSYCSTKSFNKHVTPKKKETVQTDTKIDNALAYVLDKKWSLGDTNCNLNGGAYQVFSRNFPMGYAFHAGGKAMVSDSPQEYQFIETSNTEFTHVGRVGANDLIRRQLGVRNVLAQEVTTEVKLVNSKKIEYKKAIKGVNFDALMNGRLQYDYKNEAGFGHLCE
jgi:hypothetical protein